ncbi:MAG: hypothetical protein WBG90_03090 [Saonia sp.]
MKNKIQIAAGILALYILSLPVVLVFHSQTHAQETVKIDKSDFAHITLEDDSDCQICSFYFSQQLYVQSSIAFQLEAFSYYFHQSITEIPIAVSQKQHYLRGPPLV